MFIKLSDSVFVVVWEFWKVCVRFIGGVCKKIRLDFEFDCRGWGLCCFCVDIVVFGIFIWFYYKIVFIVDVFVDVESVREVYCICFWFFNSMDGDLGIFI